MNERELIEIAGMNDEEYRATTDKAAIITGQITALLGQTTPYALRQVAAHLQQAEDARFAHALADLAECLHRQSCG